MEMTDFIGRIEVLAIRFWKEFSKISRCWTRRLLLLSEFLTQEEGQSPGKESPERGQVSTRKRDRLHDVRLLSGDWRS